MFELTGYTLRHWRLLKLVIEGNVDYVKEA